MVFLAVMFSRNQHNRISLLAVFTLLLGLVAAVPHYGHADTTHGVSSSQSGSEHLLPAPAAGGNSDDGTATGCDHGCHLGHHFNGVLDEGPKSFSLLANHPPDSNPQKFSLFVKNRDLRPPISQIS